MSNNELYHYGVLGMKWGHRKNNYLSKGASGYTKRKENRISKKYSKEMKKANDELSKKYNSMYINAHNHSVDYFERNKLTEKYNADQKKKYGKNYTKRDGYVEDYNKYFNTFVQIDMAKSVNSFYKNNKHVTKGRKLVKKYNMTSWNEFARENEQRIEGVNNAIKKFTN